MIEKRNLKRLIISIVYLIIFALAVLVIYDLATPDPTCSDGVRNQNEKGVDCGGRCAPCVDKSAVKELSVVEVALVDGGNGTYDALFKIANPNNTLGSEEFTYEVELLGEGGEILYTRSAKSYILPAETKYLAELGFAGDGQAQPRKARLRFAAVEWQPLSGVTKPQLTVVNRSFDKALMAAGGEGYGVLRNESLYDLAVIDVVVVLRDEQGNVLALSKTQKNTVRSAEERDFRLTWPYAFAAEVRKVEMEAYSNVYSRDNFSSVRADENSLPR